MVIITKLKDVVLDDLQCAAWTGNFYASINDLSTVFKFLILPILNQKMEPKVLWRLIPILPLLCGVTQVILLSLLFPKGLPISSSSSGLYLIATRFLIAKTLDYSLRNILAEMAYLPLLFEARFKGKKIIAVFANRFRKSGMALIFSGLHFSTGGSVGLVGMVLAVKLD